MITKLLILMVVITFVYFILELTYYMSLNVFQQREVEEKKPFWYLLLGYLIFTDLLLIVLSTVEMLFFIG